MNDVLDRKVWPIFAWISGGLLVSMLALTWAVSFMDWRWSGLLGANVVLLFVAVSCVGAFSAKGATYTKKPRGWRRIRREAEREAYIKKLERELL